MQRRLVAVVQEAKVGGPAQQAQADDLLQLRHLRVAGRVLGEDHLEWGLGLGRGDGAQATQRGRHLAKGGNDHRHHRGPGGRQHQERKRFRHRGVWCGLERRQRNRCVRRRGRRIIGKRRMDRAPGCPLPQPRRPLQSERPPAGPQGAPTSAGQDWMLVQHAAQRPGGPPDGTGAERVQMTRQQRDLGILLRDPGQQWGLQRGEQRDGVDRFGRWCRKRTTQQCLVRLLRVPHFPSQSGKARLGAQQGQAQLRALGLVLVRDTGGHDGSRIDAAPVPIAARRDLSAQ